MRAKTLRLSKALDRRLTRLAKRRRTTPAALLREAIDAIAAAERGSFTARAIDVVGAWKGPRDLSTNPSYFAGYGR